MAAIYGLHYQDEVTVHALRVLVKLERHHRRFEVMYGLLDLYPWYTTSAGSVVTASFGRTPFALAIFLDILLCFY